MSQASVFLFYKASYQKSILANQMFHLIIRTSNLTKLFLAACITDNKPFYL